jgi:hypothetical protein
LIFEEGENAARFKLIGETAHAKKLLVTYSASIDDLIILATVLSSSSSRDGGCLDFLEDDICWVDVDEKALCGT